MGSIFYSVAGEGRGHAARTRAIIDHLREKHEITLFAPDDAWRFLAPLYAETEVRVELIPGLRFHYTDHRQLDYRRTGAHAWEYARTFRSLVEKLGRLMDAHPPDLVITDFEPALPHAARRRGIPFVSLTHQHFLLTYDLSSLPFWLRCHAAYMKWIVAAYYRGQRETVVSSFYFPPLRRGCRHVTQVGVLLREAVTATEPTDEGHLVAYLRRFAGHGVLEALAACGREVRVYGLGAQPAQGRLTFRAIAEAPFLEDLATCSALVTTAGNQLVGEALYLRKPVLALPEAQNYEQFINAHFLAQEGAGQWVELEELTARDVRFFLSRLDEFRARINPARLNGLPAALATIARYLPSSASPRTTPARPRTGALAHA